MPPVLSLIPLLVYLVGYEIGEETPLVCANAHISIWLPFKSLGGCLITGQNAYDSLDKYLFFDGSKNGHLMTAEGK